MLNNKESRNNMKTKKELGSRYAELRSEIKSYTNDSYDDQFTFEHILKTYVPAKVLKDWIARSKVELKELEEIEKEK